MKITLTPSLGLCLFFESPKCAFSCVFRPYLVSLPIFKLFFTIFKLFFKMFGYFPLFGWEASHTPDLVMSYHQPMKLLHLSLLNDKFFGWYALGILLRYSNILAMSVGVGWSCTEYFWLYTGMLQHFFSFKLYLFPTKLHTKGLYVYNIIIRLCSSTYKMYLIISCIHRINTGPTDLKNVAYTHVLPKAFICLKSIH